MTSPSDEQDRLRDLMLLLLVDYEATRLRVADFAKAAATVRAAAIAVVLALAGAALDRHSAGLGGCAIAATLLFYYLDAYHGWLYTRERERARQLEVIIDRRYKSLARGAESKRDLIQLERSLGAHRFGPHTASEKVTPKKVVQARPVILYAGVYGTLMLIAVVTTIATTGASTSSPASTTTVEISKPAH